MDHDIRDGAVGRNIGDEQTARAFLVKTRVDGRTAVPYAAFGVKALTAVNVTEGKIVVARAERRKGNGLDIAHERVIVVAAVAGEVGLADRKVGCHNHGQAIGIHRGDTLQQT